MMGVLRLRQGGAFLLWVPDWKVLQYAMESDAAKKNVFLFGT